jgi:serine/threonine protein phosphatase PrpC
VSFFVSRTVTQASPLRVLQDRADVFARGEHAVLVVADGTGGAGDGAAAADLALARIRGSVLDDTFDLLAPAAWQRLFGAIDRELVAIGETTAIAVVLAPGILVCVSAGDSEAWNVRPDAVDRLTTGTDKARLGSQHANPSTLVQRELEGRLIVASDGLFRHAPDERIIAATRSERIGAIGDVLVESLRLSSGELPDDVAILVAEKA